jgi:hypothetical protein
MESSHQHESKWQRMFAIVNQHSTSQPDLARQFQKLFLQRALAENFLVFLLQYSGLMLSTLSAHVTPLWLASGTASAFIFLRGASVLPGIFIGCFFACLMAKSGVTVALDCALIFSLQAWLLLVVSHRFISPTLIFYQKKIFAKFIFASAILAALGGLAFEYFCYSDLSVLQCWLANLNGILIFSFALITLDSYFPQIDNLRKINLYALGLLYGLGSIFLLSILFSSSAAHIIVWSLALTIPGFLIGKRYGWCGAIALLFLSGLATSLAANLNLPLFATNFNLATLEFLQMLLSIACISLILTI